MSCLRTRLYCLRQRYRDDLPFRNTFSLSASTAFNTCYAIFKLGFGIYYRSLWSGAIAVYYLFLAAMRVFLLGASRHVGNDLAREYRAARACGCLLFPLNLALSAVTVQMVVDGKGYHYPGYLIFAAAFYAFYAATMAVINLLRYRKLKSPVLFASKVLNLAVALVSMLSLQTAMFASFGDEFHNQRTMNALTGGGVCLLLFLMAILMVTRANRQIRRYRL